MDLKPGSRWRSAVCDAELYPWQRRLRDALLTARPDALLLATGLPEPGSAVCSHGRGRVNLRAAAEENRARYLTRRSEYPADWQAAAGETFSVAHVTPEELDRMRAQVLEVMTPYIRLDPASRPAGALPVRITLDLFPWFGPEEAGAAAEGTPEEGR